MGGIGSGRPSRPKEIRDLVGEKPSRQNNNVPQLPKLTLDDVMRAPETLTGVQKTIWEYYAPGLARAGVLALADVDMLVEFCVAVDTARIARMNLDREGHVLQDNSGKSYKNPWQTVHRESVNDMQRIAARFGLTPADRARLVTPNSDEPKSQDPGRLLS